MLMIGKKGGKKRRKKKGEKKEIVLRMISWYQGLEETETIAMVKILSPPPIPPQF